MFRLCSEAAGAAEVGAFSGVGIFHLTLRRRVGDECFAAEAAAVDDSFDIEAPGFLGNCAGGAFYCRGTSRIYIGMLTLFGLLLRSGAAFMAC